MLTGCSIKNFLASLSFVHDQQEELKNGDSFKKFDSKMTCTLSIALQWQELVTWPPLGASRIKEGRSGDGVGKCILAGQPQPSNNSTLWTEEYVFSCDSFCHNLSSSHQISGKNFFFFFLLLIKQTQLLLKEEFSHPFLSMAFDLTYVFTWCEHWKRMPHEVDFLLVQIWRTTVWGWNSHRQIC